MNNKTKFFLSKVEKPHYEDIFIYRIENSNNEGVFTGGGTRFISEDFFKRTHPAENNGFSLSVINLLTQGFAFSACLSLEDLEKYFGKDNIDNLTKNNFHIVTKKAIFAWESNGQLIGICEDGLNLFLDKYYF